MGKVFRMAVGALLLFGSSGVVQGATTVDETATAEATKETATAGTATVGDSKAPQPPFFADHARGWHWYERFKGPTPKGQVSKRQASKDPVTRDTVASDPSVVVEKYRKVIERAKDQALMDPSPENMYRYMALQQDAMARSHRFAEVWQQLLLKRPELDDTVKFPTTQGARHVAYALEKKATTAVISALKDTHGLYFFFRENCPYCHSFAPIVKAFAQKHGWTVFAISMDPLNTGDQSQMSLREFPQAVRDNGFGARLGVSSVPALFVANPSAGQIMPIAHSMISEAEIEARILLSLRGKLQASLQKGHRP